MYPHEQPAHTGSFAVIYWRYVDDHMPCRAMNGTSLQHRHCCHAGNNAMPAVRSGHERQASCSHLQVIRKLLTFFFVFCRLVSVLSAC